MAINKIELSLKKVIQKAVVDLKFVEDYPLEQIVIEIPKDKAHGDYSTNIAMQLTKVLRRNPREIAQAVIDALDLEAGHIEHVEMAGPGFINLFLRKDAMTSVIQEVLTEQDHFGCSDYGQGIRYNIEFVSANPTGDLHLGHAKGAAVGDSICRIMKAAGYDVTSEYYINDAGNQITNLALSLYARYLQAFGKEAKLPEDGYHGADIIQIAENLKEEYGDRFLNVSQEEAIAYFRKIGTEHELQKLKIY